MIAHERGLAIRRESKTHQRGAGGLQHLLRRMQVCRVEDVDLPVRERGEHTLAIGAEEHLVEAAVETRDANLVDLAIRRGRDDAQERLRKIRHQHGLAIG